MTFRKLGLVLAAVAAVLGLTVFAQQNPNSQPAHEVPETSLRSADGKFRNVVVETPRSFWAELGIFWDFLTRAEDRPLAQALPVQTITPQQLQAASDRTLWKLGHSTVLLKLRGRYWLFDPIFSERASPVQWMGPRRFHPSPIALQDLPEIEAVILSHDHYDHLDYDSIMALSSKTKLIITPLGVGDRLVDWGVPATKVQQLDWWQQTEVAGLRFTATPAQHFSGRSMGDRNKTLWASWVLADEGLRLFFSGDTGYHAEFKTIGERLGPFDLTLMEAGAYNERWPHVHMYPEQTVQAHLDLRGRRLMMIHNATFDLAMHGWQEPLERVTAAALTNKVELLTPVFGAPVDIMNPAPTPVWWR